MAVLLGIDSGTTNMKAVLTSLEGQQLDLVSAPTVVQRPADGMCEMDMTALWEQLCALTNQLRRRNPDVWSDIQGVGISGQGDGMWPIDSAGNPVGNAILWNDTRARELMDQSRETVDGMLIANSGNALFAGALPVILQWLKQNDPRRFARIRTAMHCKDWLNYKLTGSVASDHTDFSTAGMSIFTKAHLPQLYDLLGIPEAKAMLPRLYAPTDIMGNIDEAGSAASGIPVGVPVITGAIDVAAAALGAGVHLSGDGCTILGTTLSNEIMIDAHQVDSSDRSGSALCSMFPGKYLRLQAALSGNSTIDWAKRLLASDLSFPDLERQLESIPMGSRGIIYHPYIAGERSPFRDPFACGGFYGLNAHHTRLEMMRAVYEGMVLSIKDCYTALPQTDGKLYISGGGAVSDFTCRLIASALNKTILRPGRKELACAGIVGAIRMGLGLGAAEDGAEIRDEKTDIFLPDPQETLQLDTLYRRYMQLKSQIQPYWKERQVPL